MNFIQNIYRMKSYPKYGYFYIVEFTNGKRLKIFVSQQLLDHSVAADYLTYNLKHEIAKNVEAEIEKELVKLFSKNIPTVEETPVSSGINMSWAEVEKQIEEVVKKVPPKPFTAEIEQKLLEEKYLKLKLEAEAVAKVPPSVNFETTKEAMEHLKKQYTSAYSKWQQVQYGMQGGGGGKPYKGKDLGQNVIKELAKVIPDLEMREVKCPVHSDFEKNTHVCAYPQASIANVIMHLNDQTLWTREQIADWLETLDVNLKIA